MHLGPGASVFFVAGLTPFRGITNPTASSFSTPILHFSFFKRSPTPLRRYRTSLKRELCSPCVFPANEILGKYDITPGIPARIDSINFWKIAGDADNPKASLL